MKIFSKIKQNKKLIFLVLTCLVLNILGGFFYYRYTQKQSHHFKVTFLNIGQGDSALIQFKDGEKMLVDCGPNKIVLSRLGQELPFYDRTIDYVLATHPDLDHYGGCVDVLKRYHVKHIIVNGRSKPDPYWQEWNKAMHESGADITVMQGFHEWTIASSTLDFVSPDDSLGVEAKASDSNNYSIVFKLTSDTGQTYLFTGDMEVPLEQALMRRYCSNTNCPLLQADILKVGHHGSITASSEEFLSVVKPKTAIISVGPNKYGHPSLRVIRHLERAGSQILRTDKIGDLVIQQDLRTP